MFEIDPKFSLDVRQVNARVADGVDSRLVTFATPFGYRRAAELVRPEAGGPDTQASSADAAAAILYVHWYEPESPDSNRSQFSAEARQMAQRGAVCLLVETMWSDPDWFIKRSQADDLPNTQRQVVELRLAMDLLLAQPGVDAARFACVGHDFGAMYGILTGSLDPRPACYVLMAGTPRFPDWYLYYPRLEGDARQAFMQEMAPFDPIAHVARLAPHPLLFQFGDDDPHVPKERAEAFYAAALEPKELRWYAAGHALNAAAAEDRQAWLMEQLSL
jgi:dienelactone hydrolase